MAKHRFDIGEVVNISNRADPGIPAGRYKVVRRLPATGSDNQYRLQSLEDGHERVAQESQLD